jgi:hypothetical protein
MRSSTPVLDTPAKKPAGPKPDSKQRRPGPPLTTPPERVFERPATRRLTSVLRRDKAALSALVLLSLLILSSVLAPVLTPHTPDGDLRSGCSHRPPYTHLGRTN